MSFFPANSLTRLIMLTHKVRRLHNSWQPTMKLSQVKYFESSAKKVAHQSVNEKNKWFVRFCKSLNCPLQNVNSLWLTVVFVTSPGKGGLCVRLTTLTSSCAVVMKSENLNFLEPSGPLQACNGIAFVASCWLPTSLYWWCTVTQTSRHIPGLRQCHIKSTVDKYVGPYFYRVTTVIIIYGKYTHTRKSLQYSKVRLHFMFMVPCIIIYSMK